MYSLCVSYEINAWAPFFFEQAASDNVAHGHCQMRQDVRIREHRQTGHGTFSTILLQESIDSFTRVSFVFNHLFHAHHSLGREQSVRRGERWKCVAFRKDRVGQFRGIPPLVLLLLLLELLLLCPSNGWSDTRRIWNHLSFDLLLLGRRLIRWLTRHVHFQRRSLLSRTCCRRSTGELGPHKA